MTDSKSQDRHAPIEISPDDFRQLGYQMVDQIADFMASIAERPVAPDTTPATLQAILGNNSLPEQGTDPTQIINEACQLLFDHSTFNGHPRFLGYITSSAAPIGALADLLAASVNPNVGGWAISPMASEIERQTVQWIAEMIGYPTDCGGLLVSGGNVANFVPFVAARRAKVNWDVRAGGMVAGEGQRLRVYTSAETHTWIQSAADLFGTGTDAICWVPTDDDFRMDITALRQQIEADKARGDLPFMVVGTAGSTAVGAVDPLVEIAALCEEFDLWFHVDGAYGAFAVMLPDASDDLKALRQADSIALDPHKWLYAPLEAGCVLVRDARYLLDAFSYHPEYYRLDMGQNEINYYEYGPQNSRGFRALKVWMALRQVGRVGYEQMIAEDIRLAEALFQLADEHPELETFTQSLSVTTFRFVPSDLNTDNDAAQSYCNELNSALLKQMRTSGDAYLTNAVIYGQEALRGCVVNFRTSMADIHALPEIIVRHGRALDAEMRPDDLKS